MRIGQIAKQITVIVLALALAVVVHLAARHSTLDILKTLDVVVTLAVGIIWCFAIARIARIIR